jgi:release factor glutamine methyltransferase
MTMSNEQVRQPLLQARDDALITIASLHSEITGRLPGETPALDAQVLLAHVTGQNRTRMLSHPEMILTQRQAAALETAIRRLESGTPLPYVIGHWEFFGLDFEITPDVLIPRPETELLVEAALGWIRTEPQALYRFLDVGTGSGCIPVALAVHVPRAEIVATDISPAALEVARRNAERHGVEERIQFVECDLIPDDGPWAIDDGVAMVRGLLSAVNVVTANLPYIPTATLTELAVYNREPTLALDGGPDGLDFIRRLLTLLTGKMAKGSLVLLEIENRHGLAVSGLAREAFPEADVQIKKDLAGYDRLAVIEI